MSSEESVSNRPKRILRGKLSRTHELQKFFEILDEWTAKGYKGLPYNQRKYLQGWQQAVNQAFGKVDPKTIWSRITDFPNGVTESSKIKRGESSNKIEQWERTACFNAIKQHSDSFDAKKGELTRKGKKYENHLKKVWAITKIDPLDMNLDDWLVFWGNPSKSVGTAPPRFTDPMTGRVSFAAAVSFRFAMQKSHAADIQQLIITKDGRFSTDNLKRPKGLHKEEFQSEEQIKTIPEFLQTTELLMMDYMGIIFGGRFDALKDITPADVKREFHQIHFFEGKVKQSVDKPIYEPETAFIWRYITDKRLAKNQKLFTCQLTYYNVALTAAGAAMARKYPALEFRNDKDEVWFLTTHRGFKHTCVSQMALHGVRRDVISDYVGTDEATLKDFYQGGSSVNVDVEIGGLKRQQSEPTWRAFIFAITKVFEARYNQLVAHEQAAQTVKA